MLNLYQYNSQIVMAYGIKLGTVIATLGVVRLTPYLAVGRTAKPVWLPNDIFFTGQLEDLPKNKLPKIGGLYA